MTKFTTDIIRKIYNDDTGDHVTVGTDRDGLDLVEVQVDDSYLIFDTDQARHVAAAMIACADELDARALHATSASA